MISSTDLYYDFHLLLNKNVSYQNINISIGNFVRLYNRELTRWLEDYFTKNNSNIRIHDLQSLLKTNQELELLNRQDDVCTFKLPDEFYRFVDCVSSVERKGCKNSITNYLHKPSDVKTILDNYPPSFDFEEGLCNISEEKVVVYIGDFKINNTYLSYYLKPTEIDIEGYQKLDGTYSTTINSSLDDQLQQEVLDRVVLEVMRQFENGNGFKLSQDRILGGA